MVLRVGAFWNSLYEYIVEKRVTRILSSLEVLLLEATGLHSFPCLLSGFSVQGTLLSTESTALNKRKKICAPFVMYFLGEREPDNGQIIAR